ncbi:MAG TPA: hypothetical protein GXX53_10300 [Tissierellia bacterium]|nr:hypothetical protein [Tissierellia bacterium]
MARGMNKSKLLMMPLIVAILIAVFSTSMLAEEDTIEGLEEKIEDITQEEKMILEDLFIKAQEIEELERQRNKTAEEIEDMKKDIKSLEKLIERETSNYDEKLNILEQVLVSYQRMGPSSFIDIILSADSITNLLERINILRDLAKNSEKLLTSIEELKDRLIAQKEKLDDKLSALKEKEESLKNTIAREEEKKLELEERLASLNEDREYYQERLNAMMAMIHELKDMMKLLTGEFINIIQNEKLPENSIEFFISEDGIGGKISENVFNDIINGNPNMPETLFHFYADRVEMEIPDKNLLLIGRFVVIDGHLLEFQVEEGKFYDMVLTRETIDEFFREGNISLDLSGLLGNNTIKKIETLEGFVQMIVDLT